MILRRGIYAMRKKIETKSPVVWMADNCSSNCSHLDSSFSTGIHKTLWLVHLGFIILPETILIAPRMIYIKWSRLLAFRRLQLQLPTAHGRPDEKPSPTRK